MSWAAVLTLGVALAMLAAPPTISWLTRSTGSFGVIMHLIVGCGAVLALRWTGDGARAGYSPGQLVPVIAALAVTLLGDVRALAGRLAACADADADLENS